MNHAHIKAILEGVVPEVKAAIDAAVGSLSSRISALEQRGADRGEKGDPGEPGRSVTVDDVSPLVAAEVAKAVAALPPAGKGDPGEAGASVTPDDVRPMLEEMVAALPLPEKGDPGEKGEAGASVTVDEVAPLIASEVASAVAALPPAAPGAKGERGEDGKPGASVTVDEVVPLIALETAKAVAAIPPAPKGDKGDRGEPGRDASDLAVIMDIAGKQAVAALTKALDTFEVITADGGRTFEFRFTVGEVQVSREIKTALPLDKGVWREGEFEPGDGVSLGGNFWIAQVNTAARPAEGKDWRLAVRHGRNGKDFRTEDRPKGDPVRLS